MKGNNEIVDLEFTRRLGLDTESIRLIIDTYFLQAEEFIHQIQKFQGEKDWIKLADMAHKAKGSVAYFGMKNLELLLKKLRLMAQAYRLTDLLSNDLSNHIPDEKELKELNNLQQNGFITDHNCDLFKNIPLSESDRIFFDQVVYAYRSTKATDALNDLIDRIISTIKLSRTEIIAKKSTLTD
jgi:hypothetical protein